ncbi:MAG: GntR family transcriptional regulator [Deltaproteobacteria bacterium]
MPSQIETTFSPIKNRRTFEQVSNEIKKFIFNGIFKPGDKLPPEKELAQQFRVGRQSVREALRILELSGFIVIQKGGGGGAVIKDSISSTISGLFLDAFQLEKITIEELTAARVEIEKIVLKHAIQQADAFDIERLRKNIENSFPPLAGACFQKSPVCRRCRSHYHGAEAFFKSAEPGKQSVEQRKHYQVKKHL